MPPAGAISRVRQRRKRFAGSLAFSGGELTPCVTRPRKPGRVFHCCNSRSRALLKINPAATQLRDDQKGYAPMKGMEECWMARQSRIRRPTGSLLRPLPLRTTTISPLAGEMPVRAPMFAPCVTTRRIPLPVHLSRARRRSATLFDRSARPHCQMSARLRPVPAPAALPCPCSGTTAS